ncbi:Imm7 family immunity protein [Paenibacillus wenxiniae]|uniref:Imm7 family immunity protein n=1 Tax=Paenibacillus wenxiniae TaxID=1636843 RepID=A0ABW4RJQ9_9BACL
MYEFHGWTVVHESVTEIDECHLSVIVENIQSYISNLNWSNGLLKLYPANGNYYVSLGGFLNRKTVEATEIMELYQFIADQAPGSYGLLYTLDDEDTEGCENRFKVFVLTRGQLTQKEDSFLSPFVPVVTDVE